MQSTVDNWLGQLRAGIIVSVIADEPLLANVAASYAVGCDLQLLPQGPNPMYPFNMAFAFAKSAPPDIVGAFSQTILELQVNPMGPSISMHGRS